MLVLVCLLLVSAAFALESGPSNKVGYVKFACGGFSDESGPLDSYTQFGLPFRFWDVPTSNVPTYGSLTTCPSSICGAQLNPGTAVSGDLISRQDGDYAWRTTASGNPWDGFLELDCAMEPATAYWFVNRRGFDITFVLAGDADVSAESIPTKGIGGPISNDPLDENYAAYSWRDPREQPMDQLGLIEQGFTGGAFGWQSDKVTQQGLTGDYAWYNTTTSSWDGFVSTVVPGEGYWITNMHEFHDWEYTYAPVGLMRAPGSHDRTPVIAKMPHKAAKTKAAIKTRTSTSN